MLSWRVLASEWGVPVSTNVLASTGTAKQPTVAPTLHTIVLLGILAAWAAWGNFAVHRMSLSGRPNRVPLYVTTMLWEWSVVAYIAWGTRRHGVPMRELVSGRWQTAKDVLKDVAVSAGFWILALIVLAATAFALHVSRAAPAVRMLHPQSRLEIVLWILISLTAGICEEITFRGYLQKQLSAWTGSIPAGLLLSAAVFGAGHIYQGSKSAVVIAVYGALFGILAETRKSLRPGMMAHAWHDGFSGLVVRLISA